MRYVTPCQSRKLTSAHGQRYQHAFIVHPSIDSGAMEEARLQLGQPQVLSCEADGLPALRLSRGTFGFLLFDAYSPLTQASAYPSMNCRLRLRVRESLQVRLSTPKILDRDPSASSFDSFHVKGIRSWGRRFYSVSPYNDALSCHCGTQCRQLSLETGCAQVAELKSSLV